jgi:hypothetical protein
MALEQAGADESIGGATQMDLDQLVRNIGEW